MKDEGKWKNAGVQESQQSGTDCWAYTLEVPNNLEGIFDSK